MQFLELSIGAVRILSVVTVLHIRVGHRWVRGASAAHTRMSIWPLFHGTNMTGDCLSSSKSYIRPHIRLAVGASREGGALVFDHFLKYIVKNCFRVIRVANLRTDAQYVTALLDIVLNIIIPAFIRKLGHFDFLACELFIQIVKIKTWWRQLLKSRWEDSCLESWHWCLELWWDKSEWFMLDTKLLVKFKCLWNKISIELI